MRLVQDRKADDIRTGKVMSSQCMFNKALSYERELGLNFWDNECPTVDFDQLYRSGAGRVG